MAVRRNGLVDYGRFIAALGIVWFHSGAPGGRLAYIALPFFLMLLAAPSRSGFRERAVRLLRPFFIWSAIYALIQVLMALHHHRAPLEWFTPSMLLTGTSLHLWFLPFALLVFPLKYVLKRPVPALLTPVVASVILVMIGPVSTVPWAQWAFGIIPVLFGFAWYAAGIRALVPIFACSAILWIWLPSPDNIAILCGSLLAVAASAVHVEANIWSTLCARLSTWIYLGHIVVLIAGRTIGLSGFPLALFGVAGSVVLAAGIETGQRRIQGSRQLAPPSV